MVSGVRGSYKSTEMKMSKCLKVVEDVRCDHDAATLHGGTQEKPFCEAHDGLGEGYWCAQAGCYRWRAPYVSINCALHGGVDFEGGEHKASPAQETPPVASAIPTPAPSPRCIEPGCTEAPMKSYWPFCTRHEELHAHEWLACSELRCKNWRHCGGLPKCHEHGGTSYHGGNHAAFRAMEVPAEVAPPIAPPSIPAPTAKVTYLCLHETCKEHPHFSHWPYCRTHEKQNGHLWESCGRGCANWATKPNPLMVARCAEHGGASYLGGNHEAARGQGAPAPQPAEPPKVGHGGCFFTDAPGVRCGATLHTGRGVYPLCREHYMQLSAHPLVHGVGRWGFCDHREDNIYCHRWSLWRRSEMSPLCALHGGTDYMGGGPVSAETPLAAERGEKPPTLPVAAPEPAQAPAIPLLLVPALSVFCGACSGPLQVAYLPCEIDCECGVSWEVETPSRGTHTRTDGSTQSLYQLRFTETTMRPYGGE